MSRGRVSFELGGRSRTHEVPLVVAINIEEATNQSVATLFSQGAQIQFRHACAIVGCLLDHHGIEVSQDDLLEWAGKPDGMADMTIAAVRILASFYEKPKKTKGATRGKSKEAETTASP